VPNSSRTLHDERRCLQIDKVLRSQLLGLGGRMKWIAQAQEAADPSGGEKVIGDHAGHTAAHRLAADDEWSPYVERVKSGDVFRIELFRSRRGLAARFRPPAGHIVELETSNTKARSSQGFCRRCQGRRIHRGAGAVRQEDGMFRLLGAVKEKRQRHPPELPHA